MNSPLAPEFNPFAEEFKPSLLREDSSCGFMDPEHSKTSSSSSQLDPFPLTQGSDLNLMLTDRYEDMILNNQNLAIELVRYYAPSLLDLLDQSPSSCWEGSAMKIEDIQTLVEQIASHDIDNFLPEEHQLLGQLLIPKLSKMALYSALDFYSVHGTLDHFNQSLPIDKNCNCCWSTPTVAISNYGEVCNIVEEI